MKTIALLVLLIQLCLDSIANENSTTTRRFHNQSLSQDYDDDHKDYGPVYFVLFTMKTKDFGEQLNTTNDDFLQNTSFDPKNPIKIIIHGHDSSHLNFMKLKTDYLIVNPILNIILVDWSNLLGFWSMHEYHTTASQVPVIGVYVAKFIQQLNKIAGIKYADLELITHSLGAHVAANAGEVLGENELGAIVAMDPSGLGFGNEDTGQNYRLHMKNAKYVEVIHTSIWFGTYDPIGHADFYMNGGRAQPGCDKCKYFLDRMKCNHHFAIRFFIESITTKKHFWGQLCEDRYCERPTSTDAKIMGGEKLRKVERATSYYVRTNHKYPYARGTREDSLLSLEPLRLYCYNPEKFANLEGDNDDLCDTR